jgi:Flp pilus assembly pilin Flp
MNAITRLGVLLSIASADLRDRMSDERGQASTEYAGILFVIVAIITALLGLALTDIGDAIMEKIISAIDGLG